MATKNQKFSEPKLKKKSANLSIINSELAASSKNIINAVGLQIIRSKFIYFKKYDKLPF